MRKFLASFRTDQVRELVMEGCSQTQWVWLTGRCALAGSSGPSVRSAPSAPAAHAPRASVGAPQPSRVRHELTLTLASLLQYSFEGCALGADSPFVRVRSLTQRACYTHTHTHAHTHTHICTLRLGHLQVV